MLFAIIIWKELGSLSNPIARRPPLLLALVPRLLRCRFLQINEQPFRILPPDPELFLISFIDLELEFFLLLAFVTKDI